MSSTFNCCNGNGWTLYDDDETHIAMMVMECTFFVLDSIVLGIATIIKEQLKFLSKKR